MRGLAFGARRSVEKVLGRDSSWGTHSPKVFELELDERRVPPASVAYICAFHQKVAVRMLQVHSPSASSVNQLCVRETQKPPRGSVKFP